MSLQLAFKFIEFLQHFHGCINSVTKASEQVQSRRISPQKHQQLNCLATGGDFDMKILRLKDNFKKLLRSQVHKRKWKHNFKISYVSLWHVKQSLSILNKRRIPNCHLERDSKYSFIFSAVRVLTNESCESIVFLLSEKLSLKWHLASCYDATVIRLFANHRLLVLLTTSFVSIDEKWNGTNLKTRYCLEKTTRIFSYVTADCGSSHCFHAS